MKKILLALIVIAIILAMVSCGPTHKHTITGELIVVKEATCGEDGTAHMFCTECGEIVNTIAISKTNNHTVVVVPAIESTCTETGLTEGKKCSECGEILIEQVEAPLKSHAEEVIHAIDATCTETGLSEGKKCSACDTVLVAQQETPIVAHIYDDKYDETCNECGFIRDAECSHRETETIVGYDSTCTSTGLTDGKKCKKCGEILVSQTVIAVKEHTVVIDEAVETTCITPGLTEGKHCGICNVVIVEQNTINAIGHTESDWIIDEEATPMETGIKHNECIMCGQILITESIPVLVSEGLEFALSPYGAGYAVVGIGTCTDEYLVIPNTYNGEPVTIIDQGAFINCTFIDKVYIPNSIVGIYDEAFLGCSSIKNIIVPSENKHMGANAFAECTSLESITLPHINISGGMATYMFRDCTSLTTINYMGYIYQWQGRYHAPNWDKNTGDYTIYCTDGTISKDGTIIYYTLNKDGNGYSVTDIGVCNNPNIDILNTFNNLPVTSIGASAFSSCASLETISIPNTVTSIGNSAFYNCTSLTSVVIPDSVTSIGNGAFYYCNLLTSIVIPDSVTNIGNWAFGYCDSLTSIVISESVTSIGEWAFAYCDSLTSIEIPDSVTSIGRCAFYDCFSLTSVIILDSVTSIGDFAFFYCDSLTIYCEAESKPEGWSSDWNYFNRPVVWGYKGE